MQFVITIFNFAHSFAYETREVLLQWSLPGLILVPKQGACRIGANCYREKTMIPWEELLSLKDCGVICDNDKIPVSLLTPQNEKIWISFVTNGAFPPDERLTAYQAYFRAEYATRSLNGTLHAGFFKSVLKAYQQIGMGTRNPNVANAIHWWEERYMEHLTSRLINADESIPEVQSFISEIKSHKLKASKF